MFNEPGHDDRPRYGALRPPPGCNTIEHRHSATNHETVTDAVEKFAARSAQPSVPPGWKWYTHFMPTTRPRYQVTETPEVARALDRAAKRWPGEPRSKLLRRLIEVGGRILERDERAEDGAHRAAVLASSGRYPQAFGPDYLAELRADWPT